jgi:hypothetical protein
MNTSLKRFGSNKSLPNRGNFLVFCLQRLRKPSKSLSQDSRCPGRNSNQAPSKYKSRSLLLHPFVRSTFSLSAVTRKCDETNKIKIMWRIDQLLGIDPVKFPAEAYARKNYTSTDRQRMSKQASTIQMSRAEGLWSDKEGRMKKLLSINGSSSRNGSIRWLKRNDAKRIGWCEECVIWSYCETVINCCQDTTREDWESYSMYNGELWSM